MEESTFIITLTTEQQLKPWSVLTPLLDNQFRTGKHNERVMELYFAGDWNASITMKDHTKTSLVKEIQETMNEIHQPLLTIKIENYEQWFEKLKAENPYPNMSKEEAMEARIREEQLNPEQTEMDKKTAFRLYLLQNPKLWNDKYPALTDEVFEHLYALKKIFFNP
jgi:hypothetical protein